MDVQSIVISSFITIFSLGLLIVSLASYKKYKNVKLAFISLVFVVFLIKGIILSYELFFGEIEFFNTVINREVFDLVILILLFVATLKR